MDAWTDMFPLPDSIKATMENINAKVAAIAAIIEYTVQVQLRSGLDWKTGSSPSRFSLDISSSLYFVNGDEFPLFIGTTVFSIKITENTM
jgi:hypothetical protein